VLARIGGDKLARREKERVERESGKREGRRRGC